MLVVRLVVKATGTRSRPSLACARNISHVDVRLTSTFSYVTPLVAVALGVVVLDERLGINTLVGAALVALSVALTVRAAIRAGGPRGLNEALRSTSTPRAVCRSETAARRAEAQPSLPSLSFGWCHSGVRCSRQPPARGPRAWPQGHGVRAAGPVGTRCFAAGMPRRAAWRRASIPAPHSQPTEPFQRGAGEPRLPDPAAELK